LARAFLTQYHFNTEAIPDYLELGNEEDRYLIPDPSPIEEGSEVIVKIEETIDTPTLPTPTEHDTEEYGHSGKPNTPPITTQGKR
jgi:hypothetical protein